MAKDALTERKSSQNAPTIKRHILLPIKVVQRTKNKHLDNVVENQKSYAAILRQIKQGSPSDPGYDIHIFSRTACLKFVANVAIQVAQPQICCINST